VPTVVAWHAVRIVNGQPEREALCGYRYRGPEAASVTPWPPDTLGACSECNRAALQLGEAAET